MGKAVKDTDRGLVRIAKDLLVFKDKEVIVGLQSGDKTKDGDMDIARLAAIHEFGGEWDITVTHYKKLSKSGKRFVRKGRFVSKKSANYAESFDIKLKIPERSFIRSTFDEKSKVWMQKAQYQVGSVIDGKKNATIAMEVMGNVMQGDVQKKMVDGPFTANSKKTISKKGSNKPLIDTGRMRQSIRYLVRNRKNSDSEEGKNFKRIDSQQNFSRRRK